MHELSKKLEKNPFPSNKKSLYILEKNSVFKKKRKKKKEYNTRLGISSVHNITCFKKFRI